MKNQYVAILIITICALAITSACTVGGNIAATAVKSEGTAAPVATQASESQPPAPSETATLAAEVRGSGSFDLEDSTVGLKTLSSYRQSTVLTFDGTVAGVETHAKTTMQRTVVALTDSITTLQVDDQPRQLFATVGEVAYHQSGEESPCVASASQAADDSLAVFSLAALPLVHGAENAGEETANGVAAQHYTFDERALGQADGAKAMGEVWVAKEGGYVVKYVLRLEGTADQLGPGVAGVQTWTYELRDVNAVSAPDLPQQCAPLDASALLPIPPEAQNVVRLPDFTEFEATLSVEQVTQFYQQQAESQGWVEMKTTSAEGADTILNYNTAEGGFISIRLHVSAENILRVTLQTLPAAQPADQNQ